MDRDNIEQLAVLWGCEVKGGNAKEVKMSCPFPDCGHRAFTVEIAERVSRCYCFACNQGGTTVRVARRLKDLNNELTQAYAFALSSESGAFVPPKEFDKPKYTDNSLLPILAQSKRGVSKGLFSRGLLHPELKKWGLRYDWRRRRDLFPVKDIAGDLRGIVGRRFGDDDTAEKYMTLGDDPAEVSKIFYGEPFIDVTRDEGTLVEGPMDAIKTSRYLPNILGLLGGVLTEERIKRLKQWFSSLTLMLDNDEAGILSMFKIGHRLRGVFPVFVSLLPSGTDPWDATPGEIKAAREERRLWSLIGWEALAGEALMKILKRQKKYAS